MRPSFLLVLLILLVAMGCANDSTQTKIEDVATSSIELSGSDRLTLTKLEHGDDKIFGTESFRDRFRPIGRMVFTDSIKIGDISGVNISEEGMFLILDEPNNSVWLFSQDGTFVNQLNSESCFPGYNWKPREAVFSPGGQILTTHYSGEYFLFDFQGECIGPVRSSGEMVSSSLLTDSNEIISLTFLPSAYGIRKINRDGILRSRFGESKSLASVISRLSWSTLLQERDGSILLSLPIWPQLFVYSQSGDLVNTLGRNPTYFSQLDEDMSENLQGRAAISKISKKLETSSLVLKALLISEQLYILEIINYSEKGLESEKYRSLELILSTKHGFAQESIFLGSTTVHIVAAWKGLLFVVTQPVDGAINSFDGNEFLVVFQLLL